MGAGKVRAKCIKDVTNVGVSSSYKAFTQGVEYDIYIEDDGDIWAYNNKKTDQMLCDFETPRSFFDKHFEIIK